MRVKIKFGGIRRITEKINWDEFDIKVLSKRRTCTLYGKVEEGINKSI